MKPDFPSVRPELMGVFSTRTAAACGWSPAALMHAVRCDRITRLARSIYVPTYQLDGVGPAADRRRLTVASIAAAMAVPTAAASHASSALLAGLPVWALPDRACLTVPPRFTGDAGCAHLHRASTPDEHLLVAGPVRRTRAARTILDTAREHGIEDAVVMGDYALRYRLTDIDRLDRVAAHCRRWPGIRRARQVVGLLDPRSESPLESVSRLRLAGTRVPPPTPQARIYDLHGRFLGRPDFYWDEFGVAGEVDGAVKYAEDPITVLLKERRRQQQMDDTGLLFVRWGMVDLADLALLTARIETVFARAARRPASDRAWVVRFSPQLPPPTLPRQYR